METQTEVKTDAPKLVADPAERTLETISREHAYRAQQLGIFQYQIAMLKADSEEITKLMKALNNEAALLQKNKEASEVPSAS